MANGTRKSVRVGKIDLDTAGTAYFLGVSREDEVVIVRGHAFAEDLLNAEIICIEVGGSGEVDSNNWDHHSPDGPRDSAAKQAANKTLGDLFCSCGSTHWNTPVSGEELSSDCNVYFGYYRPGDMTLGDPTVKMLVEYINELDTNGPEALRQERVGFPTLSDVFAGMLLTERDAVEQLHKGVEILEKIVEEGRNPFHTIEGFDSYAEAKAENNRQIAKAVEEAEWTVTQGGYKLAFLSTNFFGAPGALYGMGAEIVVAYAPQFGNPPVPKFTIAGNGIKVDSALPELNALEEGWGGPATGTILGSPRTGSKLSLTEVTEIVKRTC